MKKEKKNKEKICIACRKYFNQEILIRLVRDKDGNVFIQDDKKLEGRGLHICKNITCVENAIKRKQIKRNLKVENVPEEIYEELRKRAI